MKSVRVVLSIALLSLAGAALAQDHQMPKTEAPKSAAQVEFNSIKTLAGDWDGKVSVDPPQPDWKGPSGMHVRMRVTSRGNAVVHELQQGGTPLDPSKYDHPVTMLYLDKDQLNLVHYCDAGNRPHMVARKSADGKTIEFDFVDMSGGNQYGHMHHAVFTIIDANHHIEDWTYMMPGDKPIHAHFDLQRASGESTVAAKLW